MVLRCLTGKQAVTSPRKTDPVKSRGIRKRVTLEKGGLAEKKSRFTEEQIAFALKQAETGTRVAEVCRKMGISEATFYNWKKRYGGLGVSELRRLK
jgi:DNA invertase Pin-like site-specific DNA recombinase